MEKTQWNDRTKLLLGETRVKELQDCHVLVVGLGGVGAYAAEQLCRSGIGHITMVDGDVVSLTNLNRQLPALQSTMNLPKVDILKKRFEDINTNGVFNAINQFLTPEDIPLFLEKNKFDFVIDAIDTVASKVELLTDCHRMNTPVISSMGAGAKLNPELIKIADISKTTHCSLAKVIRQRLSKNGIKHGIPTVFSTEISIKGAVQSGSQERGKGTTVGSISFIPAIFGCYLAGYVVNHIKPINL